MISRMLARQDSVTTTVAYTAITSTLVTSIPLMAFWRFPENGFEVSLLTGLAISASIGEVLIIKSLAIAEANRVAPVHYTLIIWGTLYGYLFFGQMPDAWTYLGTAIVIAAGLFTLHTAGRVKAER